MVRRWMRDVRTAAGMVLLALVGVLGLLWMLGRGAPAADVELASGGADTPVSTVDRTTPPRVERPVERRRIEVEPPPEPVAPPEPPPAPAAEPEPVVRVQILDLWGDAPVPNLRVALGDADVAAAAADSETPVAAAPDAPPAHSTDASGVVEVPARFLPDAIRSADDDWRLVTGEPGAGPDGTCIVRAYRMLDVTGELCAVGTDATLPFATVELSALAHGTDTFGDPGGSSRSVPEQWLVAHGLRDLFDLPRPNDEGRFAFRIPRLPRTLLRAYVPADAGKLASGWRTASYLIPDAVAASGTAHVRLDLERGYEVSGAVVDEAGRSVAGALVTLHVVHYVDKSDLRPSFLRRFGTGYTARWNPTMPKAVVDYKFHAWTDDAGRFSMVAAMDGEMTFTIVPATEHALTNVPTGSVSQFSRTDPLVVRSADDGARVRLYGPGGARFKRRQVLISDISYGDIQPLADWRTDEDSCVPARLLVAGHLYHFEVLQDGQIYPLADSFVVWDGGPELELVPWRRQSRNVNSAESGTR